VGAHDYTVSQKRPTFDLL